MASRQRIYPLRVPARKQLHVSRLRKLGVSTQRNRKYLHSFHSLDGLARLPSDPCPCHGHKVPRKHHRRPTDLRLLLPHRVRLSRHISHLPHPDEPFRDRLKSLASFRLRRHHRSHTRRLCLGHLFRLLLRAHFAESLLVNGISPAGVQYTNKLNSSNRYRLSVPQPSSSFSTLASKVSATGPSAPAPSSVPACRVSRLSYTASSDSVCLK